MTIAIPSQQSTEIDGNSPKLILKEKEILLNSESSLAQRYELKYRRIAEREGREQASFN